MTYAVWVLTKGKEGTFHGVFADFESAKNFSDSVFGYYEYEKYSDNDNSMWYVRHLWNTDDSLEIMRCNVKAVERGVRL